MPYFLCEGRRQVGEEFAHTHADAAHLLQSRRIRRGEQVQVQDEAGARFLAELTAVRGRTPHLLLLEALPVPHLPTPHLTLVQAQVKDKALESLVQKCTELGAAHLVLFAAEHSSLPKGRKEESARLERLGKIAWEACKQSGRQFPPAITWMEGLGAALGALEPGGARLMLHPGGERLPDSVRGAEHAAVLVGPEGGLTNAEVARAVEAGFTPWGLGGYILRADTAAMAACAAVFHAS